MVIPVAAGTYDLHSRNDDDKEPVPRLLKAGTPFINLKTEAHTHDIGSFLS